MFAQINGVYANSMPWIWCLWIHFSPRLQDDLLKACISLLKVQSCLSIIYSCYFKSTLSPNAYISVLLSVFWQQGESMSEQKKNKKTWQASWKIIIIIIICDVLSSMVTHIRNWSSAFNPSKCTHTAVSSEHTHCEHTPGAVGNHCSSAREAIGGSVPCSRAPQPWYWRWRECCSFTIPTFNPCRPETRTRNLWITSPTL